MNQTCTVGLSIQMMCKGETFFDMSFNSDQICIGFKADNIEKVRIHVHLIRFSGGHRIQNLLKNKQFFFTVCSRIILISDLFFKTLDGISASKLSASKPHPNLTSIYGCTNV